MVRDLTTLVYFLVMIMFMEVLGNKAINKVLDIIFGKMEVVIKENLIIIKDKDVDFISGKKMNGLK